ncbi:MAG: glycogen synthase GlgA [Planctomycetota bacterium]
MPPSNSVASSRPLKIALVSSEVAPFAKTGGLADVVAALARALHRAGHDVRVILPAYRMLRAVSFDAEVDRETPELELELPGDLCRIIARQAPLPNSERADGTPLAVTFLDCPRLWHRDNYYTDDADEPLRWAAFARAAIEYCQRTSWAPDVFHANDWHAALIPLLLRTRYAWDTLFRDTRTLLSIHNLGYQGVFPADAVELMGLSEARPLLHQDHLQAGHVSLLETGVLYADFLSTVSETYAREIQTPEHGMGMDELLRTRSDRLVGITNGIDAEEWNPAKDGYLAANYSADDLSGKRICRGALLDRFDLASDDDALVMGVVSRMTAQKGFELLPEILTVVLQRENVRLVVLGSGEQRYEAYFQWLRDTFPTRVGVYFGYNEELAHQIEAGADLFLMPSRYEPCGLNQMYSLAYGTVPLVRHTGGLADTVQRWDPTESSGTGFVFYDFTADALLATVGHALEVWREPAAWARLVQNGMAQDVSWEHRSEEYVRLYRHILKLPR